MSKKSRKRNKKILAALALAGGAAMLAKGRGKSAVTGVVNPNAPKTNWITKKTPAVAADVVSKGTDKFRPRVWPGTKLGERAALPGAGVKAPPSILNPYKPPRGPGRFGNLKGGGIAKRGNGAAYKSGGRTGKQFGGGLNRPVARPIGGVGGVGAPVRPLAYKHGGKVKSMGVAKRGGGIAKR
jgi:hypothetical protein